MSDDDILDRGWPVPIERPTSFSGLLRLIANVDMNAIRYSDACWVRAELWREYHRQGCPDGETDEGISRWLYDTLRKLDQPEMEC